MRRRAEAAGVGGWITNRDDGAVEAVFEGEPQAVEELVALSRSGPGRAEVTDLDVSEEAPQGITGFEIR